MLKLALPALLLTITSLACLAQEAKPLAADKLTSPASASAQPMTTAPVRSGSPQQHVVPVPTAPKQTTKTGGGVGGGSN